MSFVESISEADESVSAIMKRFPDQGKPLMMLTEVIMRTGQCSFSFREREIIGAFASGTNACTYCFDSHRATAEAFGVDHDLLHSALQDLDRSAVDERLKPVLRFVEKLTKTPSRMVQSDADAIFDAGWDESCFHFAVMICAMFNMYNRIIEGYGVKNTAAFRQSSGAALAVQGYLHN